MNKKRLCWLCDDTGLHKEYSGLGVLYNKYCDCKIGRDLYNSKTSPNIVDQLNESYRDMEKYKSKWIKCVGEISDLKQKIGEMQDANEEQIRVYMLQKEELRQKVEALRKALKKAIDTIAYIDSRCAIYGPADAARERMRNILEEGIK